MKEYKITWEKKDKYLPLQRITRVKATNEIDAKAVLHKTMGNEKKINIISIEEVEISAEEECDK
jgi:hypothetical protein